MEIKVLGSEREPWEWIQRQGGREREAKIGVWREEEGGRGDGEGAGGDVSV
jgi:hypothetical protein